MNSPLFLRSIAALLLLAALLAATPPSPHGDAQLALLIDRSVAEQSTTIHERVVSEAGSAVAIIIEPDVVDTGKSLADALWTIRPGQRSAIVIASSGYWSGDEAAALQAASDAGVAVMWLPVAEQTGTSRIAGVHAIDSAVPGQLIGITVDPVISGTNAAELVLLAEGDILARTIVSEPGIAHLQVRVPASGPMLIDAEMRDIETGEIIDAKKEAALVNVQDAPSVLVVSRSASYYASSLRAGGWAVTEVATSRFSSVVSDLAQFSVLVLDDIAVADLLPGDWQRIDAAVRREALGLLVLGGPHSFSLGAYRDSLLEKLLPVLSQPPSREASASLVFLIDVSGSMGMPGSPATPLQVARQAVLETSQALRPIDRVGLMSFDVAGRVLLPLNPRADHARSLAAVWPGQASGGTQLIESLQQAVSILQDDSGKQKLLVLVSDGNLSTSDINAISGELADSDVELLAMLIGEGQQHTNNGLEQVMGSVAGRLVRVNDVLRLPSLMRQEVESARPAIVSGPVTPLAISATAWLPDVAAWPAVDQYLLTSPVEGANMDLVSEHGDALIASGTAGAGRVVAITFGLSEWAGEWLAWRNWPDTAANLARYLAARDNRAARLKVSQTSATAAQLTVESGGESRRPVSATLISPSALATRIDFEPDDPKRLSAALSLDEFGKYTVVVNDGLWSSRYQFINRPIVRGGGNEVAIAEKYVADGLLLRWKTGALKNIGASNEQAWLAALALAVFLASIVLAVKPQLFRRPF